MAGSSPSAVRRERSLSRSAMTTGESNPTPIRSSLNDTCCTRTGISEGMSAPSCSSKAVWNRYRPIDEKKLDIEAAFVEIGASEGDRWVVLQAGRQELNYGSGRLVSVREGPNVRQSFDGAKLKIKFGAWRIDAFAARPDLDKPGFFDNVPDHRTA